MKKRQPPNLSKSRYLAGLQCQLRLWYQCYEPGPAKVDAALQGIFDTGHQVGELATRRYPGGVLVDADHFHPEEALAHTQDLLADPSVPAIFEAAFRYENVLVRTDILVRQQRGAWDLQEVKSTLGVKEPHIPDLAIQCWVLRGAGLAVRRAGILTLNGGYVYAGGEHDVISLFALHDLTRESAKMAEEIAESVAQFHQMLRAEQPPTISPGDHCFSPYECPFYEHCTRGQEFVEHPIEDLPSLRGKRKEGLTELGIESILGIPDDHPLTELQARVRDCVCGQRPYVSPDLPSALQEPQYPIHHLDFETFSPAVPLYIGTCPYQVLPFQWSNHIENPDGTIRHEEYLCDDDKDPRQDFAESLLASLGDEGSICIYSPYEIRIIRDLAADVPALQQPLLALLDRAWDLCQVIKKHFYHPDFHGSFSLKAVLPALVPTMCYDSLAIQEGNAASCAYMEFVMSDDTDRQQEIRQDLLEYCGQDTLGMVELRRALGRVEPASTTTPRT